MMELKITSMTPADRLYAYNQSSQLEGQTGCIGHLRGDFGSGQEFYTSWFDHRREYKTDEFTLLFSTARMGVLLSHVGEEQPQSFALFAHRGFPRQDIENNHVAGFVHKTFQRKDAVTADKIISVHIRHLAL